MRVNQAGIQLIKSFEGCKLTAYKCPAGVWTIGYGTTGQDIKQGLVWTQQQADNALEYDVNKFALGVDILVKPQLNDNQFSALVSFAYNCGLTALRNSTLLKKVNDNPNDLTIAGEFAKWNKGGGNILPGLVKRRKAESDLYFS